MYFILPWVYILRELSEDSSHRWAVRKWSASDGQSYAFASQLCIVPDTNHWLTILQVLQALLCIVAWSTRAGTEHWYPASPSSSQLHEIVHELLIDLVLPYSEDRLKANYHKPHVTWHSKRFTLRWIWIEEDNLLMSFLGWFSSCAQKKGGMIAHLPDSSSMTKDDGKLHCDDDLRLYIPE